MTRKASNELPTPPDPRKGRRVPEGSIICRKQKRRDKTAKRSDVEIVYTRVRYMV